MSRLWALSLAIFLLANPDPVADQLGTAWVKSSPDLFKALSKNLKQPRSTSSLYSSLTRAICKAEHMIRATFHLPDHPFSRFRRRHDADDIKDGGDLHLPTRSSIPRGTSKIANLCIALWPFIAHGTLTIFITLLMIFYVNNNSFNLEERRPNGSLANGSRFRPSQWRLLQSDITTLISVLLAVLRLMVAAWLGPLCWRYAFLLMEKIGLRADQLYNIIAYNIPALPRAKPLELALWVVLVLTLPVYFVAPILTGSITWASSFNVIAAPTGSVINVSAVTHGVRWLNWTEETFWQEHAVRHAVGLANIAWSRDSPHGSSKRVLPSSVNLRVNSTVTNVTLPYFHVSALEWVSNPEIELTQAQLNVRTNVCDNITIPPVSSTSCPLLFDRGSLAIIESTPMSWNINFPLNTLVTETRLLTLYAAWRNNYTKSCVPDNFDRRVSGYFPTNAGFYPDLKLGHCWMFAWVNYTAGIGTCFNCRISSYSTVQADDTNPLRDIRGDYVAGAALRLMPSITGTLAAMNVSVPSAWDNLDRYVVEFLERSYAVSWAAVTNFVGEYDPQLSTTYRVAVPASQALVDIKRVYLWLCLHLLITISGILFLVVQADMKVPVITDTTLTAFYLDSSEVYEPGSRPSLKEGALIRVRYEDGHMKMKIE
ncbi:hypothetical protein RSOLAG1IB_10486 [Rhizoctonia solani AG-1 IB]|uniref:Transmembrane protein n=1 Tax=Thanatephorus cucumeris (strain AG1-IB / isolate 7/3/14) TaxID=1108050 RepID=A0A0B7G110_THACB|nr:hypothetical protein RSOLAG1IB_10486 [Rhizoctonia solani AG-1 IB]